MIDNKERMLNGELFKGVDDKIIEMKIHGRKLSYLYNQTTPFEEEKRSQLIRELLGSTGKNVVVKPPFYCSHGLNIHVGENCFINFNCIFLDINTITIGNHVQIGPRVSIYTVNHPIDPIVRRTHLEYALPVVIGDDVWIGGSVTINPGVTIGNNSIIGSGSVVTKDIPSNVIAAGNPAKVIRKITQEDTIYWQEKLKEYEDLM